MLRRYGEQALKEDVAGLLQLWSGHIQSSGLILVAATKSVRSALFESCSEAFSKDDPRVTFVPFQVGRPTLETVQLIHERCTAVFFGLATPSEAAEEPRKESACVSCPREVDVKKPQEEASVEEPPLLEAPFSRSLLRALLSDSESEALALIRQASADPHSLAEMDLPTVLNLPDSLQEMNTALHVASSRGLAKVVQELLLSGADPCRLDVRGRTAYLVAKDKDVRDVFRRYRGRAEAAADSEKRKKSLLTLVLND